MRITSIEIEKDLDACQGASTAFVVMPERDLSTPRGRLLFVRDVVSKTPAEKIDMDSIQGRHDGCGCAIFHTRKIYPDIAGFELDGETWDYLFSGTYSEYPKPTGAPAKAEFLRRIDVVLAKG